MAKPTIPQVLPLLERYYSLPGNSVGGVLHVVLEDGNVDDGHVLGCCDRALHESEPLVHEGAALALVLLAVSKTQRRKLGHLAGR
jgi:hypothetical protein